MKKNALAAVSRSRNECPFRLQLEENGDEVVGPSPSTLSAFPVGSRSEQLLTRRGHRGNATLPWTQVGMLALAGDRRLCLSLVYLPVSVFDSRTACWGDRRVSTATRSPRLPTGCQSVIVTASATPRLTTSTFIVAIPTVV